MVDVFFAGRAPSAGRRSGGRFLRPFRFFQRKHMCAKFAFADRGACFACVKYIMYNVHAVRARFFGLPPPRSVTLGRGSPSSTSTPPRHVRGPLYTNGRAGRASVAARARTPSAKRPRVRAPSRNAAMRQPSADVHATGEDRRPIDRSSLPDASDRARPFRSAAGRHGVRRFGDADADGRRDGEQSEDGNTAG